MRIYSIVLFSLFCVISSYAQTLGESIRCVYSEDYILDSAKPQDVRHDEFALDIHPDGRSAFYSVYERAIRTSRDSMLRRGMTSAEIISRQVDMPRTHQYFEYFKNVPVKGSYRCYDKVVKTYSYEDKLPSLQWHVDSETKELLGYTCQKATASIGGRTWNVWFTPDVPVSEGPWLLCGLPGLVLEAVDSEGLFHFKAIELKNGNGSLEEPQSKRIIRCTKKEFLTLRKNYDEDPTNGLRAVTGRNLKIMGPDGKPVKSKKKLTNHFEK